MKFRRIGAEIREVSKFPPGLALYTLRDSLREDYFGTLKKVADMGYHTVELFGHEHIPAREMKRALYDLGLRAVSIFVRGSDLEKGLKEHLEYAKSIKSQFIVTDAPAETFQDETKFQGLITLLKKTAKILKQNNLQLLYHPHAPEFEKINNQFILDRLLKGVGPDLQLELDVYWIKKAGLSPHKTLKKYKGRVPLIHVKDIGKQGETKEVGYGNFDWPSIFSVATDIGVRYYFVEQDVTPHPLKSVEMSIDYLKSIGFN